MEKEKEVSVTLTVSQWLELGDAGRVSIFADTYKNDPKGKELLKSALMKIDAVLFNEWFNA